MPQLTRRRCSTREEANERRRKVRQRRKRKFSAIKKLHELHKICGYTVACLIINPETGQAYTYRSGDHELSQLLIENIPRFNLVSENLLPKDVEQSLQRRSSQDDLEDEGVSEDEDEGAELYQTPSSEPLNEEIRNHNGSVTQQTVLFEHGIDLATPQSVIPSDRRSAPEELVPAPLTRLPTMETTIRGPQTISTADSPYVNSMAEDQVEPEEYHDRVESPSASATPLLKKASRPSDRSSHLKRRASLKEEMKRLLRIQQIHEELSRMRTAGEVEESDFESNLFDHDEEVPNNG